MPSQAYRQMEGINYSSLKHMLAGPDVYKFWKENPFPASPAMKLGELIHLAVLEPEEFEKHVYFAGKHNRATNVGKEAYARELEEAGARIMATPEEKLAIDRALLALSRSDYWKELLMHGEPQIEVAMQWLDEESGYTLKGCADFILDAPTLGPYVIDLKTSREMLNIWDVRRYHYDMQAAYYLEGYKALTGRDADFMWMVIETAEPYGCQIVSPNPDIIASGKTKMRECLNKLKQAEESGDWYSRYNQITVI